MFYIYLVFYAKKITGILIYNKWSLFMYYVLEANGKIQLYYYRKKMLYTHL